MGLMQFLGLAPAIRRTAEVFVANRTERARHEHAEHVASLSQLGAEFEAPGTGWFDALVNGLNRMPRPALALGTLALFGFAMADPVAFGVRMQGLALVPEPLWWLLGAIVSFYFGARELHHFRGRQAGVAPADVAERVAAIRDLRALETPAGAPAENAAIADWRSAQG
ncbi:MAG: holin family protein [Pseudomonadota bacterium]